MLWFLIKHKKFEIFFSPISKMQTYDEAIESKVMHVLHFDKFYKKYSTKVECETLYFLSEEESLFLNYINTITKKINVKRDIFTLFIYENKLKVLFVYTHNNKRGDIYILSESIYHKCHFLEVSVSVKNLLKAQKQFFPKILKTFSKPEMWEKKDHWAWYVWPTKKEGIHDPLKTAVKNVVDIEYILSDPVILLFWKQIFSNLAGVIDKKGRKGIPSLDHGRIGNFIKEWTSENYQRQIVKYPEFSHALELFLLAWRKASKKK